MRKRGKGIYIEHTRNNIQFNISLKYRMTNLNGDSDN